MNQVGGKRWIDSYFDPIDWSKRWTDSYFDLHNWSKKSIRSRIDSDGLALPRNSEKLVHWIERSCSVLKASLQQKNIPQHITQCLDFQNFHYTHLFKDEEAKVKPTKFVNNLKRRQFRRKFTVKRYLPSASNCFDSLY